MRLIEVIKCGKCGEEHNCYDYDEPGEFPCGCGEWLKFDPFLEPDWDARRKDAAYETHPNGH